MQLIRSRWHGTLALAVTAVVAASCVPPGGSSSPAQTAASRTAPLTNASVAYDAARKAVVLVTSGPIGHPTAFQTWTWDGHGWTKKTPITSPPARSDALLAYDAARQVTVLQGGASTQSLADTWEWDGKNWTQRTPAHTPDSGLQHGSMAYDPTGHRILLYQPQHQTWTWDGKDWAQMQPAQVPDLWNGDLVFDGTRVILVGSSSDGNWTETWGWTGNDWTLLAKGHTPELPPLVRTAFDPAHGKAMLYGGGPGDDTWTWNGSSWRRERPRHSPIGGWPPHLTYDMALGEVAAFTGPEQGTMTGTYGWTGADWTAIGAGTRPALAAGNGMVPVAEAAATIFRTVTNTRPVLLPNLPAGVDQAIVTADAGTYSLRVRNDDRSIQVNLLIGVAGNSNLGAANKAIAFRRNPNAYYQYIANDPTGWRDVWWVERPGHSTSDLGVKDPSGIPYILSATGLTEAQFFALGASLH